jgi:hypothetical protein
VQSTVTLATSSYKCCTFAPLKDVSPLSHPPTEAVSFRQHVDGMAVHDVVAYRSPDTAVTMLVCAPFSWD